MKTCRKCGTPEPPEGFGKSAYLRKDGTRTTLSRCRPCRRAASADWRDRNPERVREKQLLRTYGITAKDWDDMLEEQHGVCAVCLGPPVDLQVDHDHRDGRVRNLVCGPCNRMMGCGRDDPRIFERAAAYLREWHACREVV